MWLYQRAGRLQAGAIEGAKIEAIIKLLTHKFGNQLDVDKITAIAIYYVAGAGMGKRDAIQAVAQMGITAHMIEACAFELQSQNVMLLDKMRVRCEQSIDQAETRLMSPTHPKKGKKTKVRREKNDESAELAPVRANGHLN